MNNIFKTTGLYIALVIALSACNSTTTETYHEQTATTELHATSEMHKAVVEKVLHTSDYTYLLMNENGSKTWIVIPITEVNPGETYYYKDGIEMPDFKSKELDRTFDKVYFVEEISVSPVQAKSPGGMQQHTGKQAPAHGVVAETTHTEDEVALARLFANPDGYANKIIKVRGTVVKVNRQIMGKNWIHIQDGTEYNGQFDLTITTTELVKTGNVVGFEGTIVLDKDFGYGYRYNIIMEEAAVVSTETPKKIPFFRVNWY
jgi:starvation-inducible outer membrane lipoprotein